MLKNMKIGKKLILTFVIVAIIASAAGITSIFTTANIDKQYSNALTNFGFAQGDAGKLLASFIRIDGNVHDAISYSSVEHSAEAAKKYGEMVLKMPDLFANLEQTLLTDTEKQALVKVETAFNNYKKLADELLEEGKTANAGKIVQLQKRLVNELDPIYVEIYDEVQQIFNDKVSRGNVISANVSKLVFIVGLISVVLSVIAVIVAIVLGILVSKSVTKPLQEIEKASLDLSEGKLDIEVDYKSKNELGVVADSFRKFTGNLKFIINDIIGLLNGMSDSDFTVKSQNADAYINSYEPIKVALRKILNDLSSTLLSVNQSAAQVNAGSDQVSGGAQALSQGATEQASSIEELSATINDITNKIRENAENAKIAGKESEEAGQGVTDSNAYMKQMIEAMEDITEKSNEIGNIIKTIDDIAFQTNILALNAAVEAARAGAAGKGFAVVADEVRNLAAKSAEAAKGTTALIEGAIEAVQNGTKIADNTAKALGVVVEKAGGVNKLIQQIAKASEEQANGVAQISIGVDQISAVVQTNSATAEESAAASEELSSQSALLKELTSKFKLANNTSEVAQTYSDQTNNETTDVYFNDSSKY